MVLQSVCVQVCILNRAGWVSQNKHRHLQRGTSNMLKKIPLALNCGESHLHGSIRFLRRQTSLSKAKSELDPTKNVLRTDFRSSRTQRSLVPNMILNWL